MNYSKYVLLFFLIIGEVFAGNDLSNAAKALGVGLITGGAGLALGVPMAAAVTTGVTAAGGVIAGVDTRVGAQVGGNGEFQGTFAQVRDNRGHLIADVRAEPAHVDMTPPPTILRPRADTIRYDTRPRLNEREQERIRQREKKRREEEQRARKSFANCSFDTHYSIKFVEGLEYHVAENRNYEFLTLGIGRRWKISNRKFIGFSQFKNQPSNLEFEKTPLRWHFDIKEIDGRRYNHAWTDTMLDFMVPEGEQCRICAPFWYIRQHEAEQREISSRITSVLLESKPVSDQKKGDTKERKSNEIMSELPISAEKKQAAEGYLQEANWGILNAARAINMRKRREAKGFAEGALSYYEKAAEILRPVATFSERVFQEFAVPGGVENLRKYREGELTSNDYDLILSGEIATDAAAGCLGSFIGGAGVSSPRLLNQVKARKFGFIRFNKGKRSSVI